MEQHTIESAIIQVLKRNPNGLTPKEITEKIIDQKLYQFKAEEPASVVDHTIRKSLEGVDIAVSKEQKVFTQAGVGSYKLAG